MRLSLILVCIVVLTTIGCQSATPPPAPSVQPPPPAASQEAPVEAPMEAIVVAVQPPDATHQAIDMLDWMMFQYELVHFEFDSFDLTEASRNILKQKAKWIKSADQATQIVVTGHCDQRGSDDYNKKLGALRANAVKQYLVACGVPFQKIRIVSAGSQQPLDEGENESAWTTNRRAEFDTR